MKKIILMLFIVFLSSCQEDENTKIYSVRYVLSANGDCDVFYSTATGGGEEIDVSGLTWDHSFSAKSGTHLHISATVKNKNGVVSVKIYVDGELFKEDMKQGSFVKAIAEGYLPN